MRNEFTAIIEPGEDGWWIGHCAEVPGANGQGRTPEEALDDLKAAIELMLEFLREEGLARSGPGALRHTVMVG